MWFPWNYTNGFPSQSAANVAFKRVLQNVRRLLTPRKKSMLMICIVIAPATVNTQNCYQNICCHHYVLPQFPWRMQLTQFWDSAAVWSSLAISPMLSKCSISGSEAVSCKSESTLKYQGLLRFHGPCMSDILQEKLHDRPYATRLCVS